MTVATFTSTSSHASSPSTHTTNPAKTRKLSQASYSSSQSHFLSKKLRLLSGNSTMASAGADNDASQLSRSSSTSTTTTTSSSSRSKPSLTLDLSNLPSLSRPSAPSNTLIITELHKLIVFQPACLAAIREKITSVAPLNSFSPLPSFRRILCSFLSVDDAVKVRQSLECTKTIFDECGLRARIYFGEHTPIVENTEEAKRKKLLEAPHASKMFFISPPPSPPHGWVMRNEEPPNKEVHASDLADALARLGTSQSASDLSSDPLSPISVDSASSDHNNNNNNINLNFNKEVTPGVGRTSSWPSSAGAGGRSRSSTLIYHPNDHGGSPNLPAVMVVDTTVDDDEDVMNLSSDGEPKKILAHTSRPPVELME
jgi:Calcipressin